MPKDDDKQRLPFNILIRPRPRPSIVPDFGLGPFSGSKKLQEEAARRQAEAEAQAQADDPKPKPVLKPEPAPKPKQPRARPAKPAPVSSGECPIENAGPMLRNVWDAYRARREFLRLKPPERLSKEERKFLSSARMPKPITEKSRKWMFKWLGHEGRKQPKSDEAMMQALSELRQAEKLSGKI